MFQKYIDRVKHTNIASIRCLLALMRRPCSFREIDVRRAVKAARSSGIDIARLEIEPVTGKITIMTSNSGAEKITDLDRWVAEHAHKT
jgi:hypothetical protein